MASPLLFSLSGKRLCRSETMTILHLISSEGYYGAEAMLVTLARMQNAASKRAIIAAFVDSRAPHTAVATIAQLNGITVETVPCRGRWDVRARIRIEEIIADHHAELLHTHGYKADFYGSCASKRSSVSLVATCHNWPDPRPLMQAYAIFDRWILRGFDGAVAVSETVAARLRRSGFPEKKLQCIPNGVDVARFEPVFSEPQTDLEMTARPVIGFVGRLVPEKGVGILLAAARLVVACVPNALFVLAGDGSCRSRWECESNQLGLSESVKFLGAQRDMSAFYAAIDMMVLPSFEEATPISILEAMAAGKPVVATRVGGIPSLISPEVNGILVEPGDVPGLADAMIRLLAEPEVAAEIGRNGHEYVVLHHSAAEMETRYAELYGNVLRSRSRYQTA